MWPGSEAGRDFSLQKIPDFIFVPCFPHQGTAGSPWAGIGQLQLLPSYSRSLIFLWKSGSCLCPVHKRSMLGMSNSGVPDLSHGKELPEAPRDVQDPHGAATGLDLGFLPPKLSIDLIRKIPGRESLSQALREAGKLDFGKPQSPLLKSLEFSVLDFLFPMQFSRQIPLFLFPAAQANPRNSQSRGRSPFFPMKNPWQMGFFQKAGRA